MPSKSPIKPLYKVAKTAATQTKQPMFTLLLSSVVVATGTYFLYRYFFAEPDDDPEPTPEPESDSDDDDDGDGFKLRIFFGSQSGTAEGFAFDMEKEAKRYGFKAKAIDLEDYDPEDLQNEQLVIFLVATYGEGEPTDNAQDFYNWLTGGDRIDDELNKLEFTVFGLGNSQYEFFNSMGRSFDKKLEEFGGTRIFERGEGDDDIGSIEDQFGEWKEKLWPQLCSKYLGIDDIGVSAFESTLNVDILSSDHVLYPAACSVKYPYNYSNYSDILNEKANFLPSRHKPWNNRIGICKMSKRYQLRQNTNDGSSLHIEFDIKSDNKDDNATDNPFVSYNSADNMGIIARNDYKQMANLCKRLSINPHDVIRISAKDSSKPNYTFPQVITIRNLFLWFLDINGLLGKRILTTLANDFTNDQDEKEQLLKLCDNDNINQIHKQHMTLLQILNKFQSINIDLSSIIELLKPLQPRLYTISTSKKLTPNTVGICIKLEQHNLIKVQLDDVKVQLDDKVYGWNGVCSNYLLSSAIGDLFQYYIEESKFRLPSYKIPVIMISVGAGIAPFAAFIDEGNYNISHNNISPDEYGEWWLFFGCRHKNGDYIYKNKLESALNDKNGCLTELQVAFSRDQKDKIYVQHLIEEHQEKLWELINDKKARIYVCGGVAMGKAVRETFMKIFTFYDKNKDGHKYLDDMLHHDIYVQELWG